jgi:hypothetical protein
MARGDGLSLYLEPSFALSHVETKDQLGFATQQDFKLFTQNYRLNFDRSIGPALMLSAGALYESRRTWTTDSFGSTTLDGNIRGLFARLTLGMPVLSGGVSYDLNSQQTANAPAALVNQNLTGYVGWLPWGLPELNLRVNYSRQYDTTRTFQDLSTWSALGSVRYIVSPFEFRYYLNWALPKDYVTGTEASALDQSLQGIYSQRLFEGRTAVYVSLTLRNQMLKTLATGAGTISQQQHPVTGLSLVEIFPNVPTLDTLLPNPALIDGNLVTSASVDLGFAPTLAGDDHRRDLGMEFADLVTPVNSIQVWVDRALPPELSITYTWEAFQSDDNKTWTPVSITGPVTFGPFQNRFEIPIRQTQARFLKVVTQPMRAGLTVDNAYANVFVTEIQAFLVRPADSVPLEQATSGFLLNANASTLLWRGPNLNWDITGLVERRTSPGLTTWNLVNTLTANQWLSRTLQVNERIARQDSDQGLGHIGQTDWTLGLLWRPLATFLGSISYNGQFVDARPKLDLDTGQFVNEPVGFTHSISALARADLYEGISALVNATGSLENLYDGTNTWSGSVNATATLTPNPWMSFTLGWISNISISQPVDAPTVNNSTARIDGSMTLRPTNSISAVGTISRILFGAVPTTYGTVQLNYSPLRGDLQLYVVYSKTFDTASLSTTEFLTPGLRWNVRPGVQITGSYTLLNSTAAVSQAHSRTLNLGLSILL